MTQQTMTKEQILESRISCTCNEAYKTRQMSDPDCGRCNWYEEILSCMEEYKEQEVAKERERAEKMVSDLDKLAEKYKAEGRYVSWAAIKQITGSYRNNLPPETTGNQTAC